MDIEVSGGKAWSDDASLFGELLGCRVPRYDFSQPFLKTNGGH
jgi:hypothetical protein